MCAVKEGNTTEQLAGTVEHITFANNDTGFAVVELDAGGELVTAVGLMPGVAEGEEVDLGGEYVTHPSFGPQFRVATFSCRLPQDEAAILRYLASGVLPGIGPVTARRIVDAFGPDALFVIEQQPEQLATVKGMTGAKARAASEEFRRVFGVREAIAALSQLQLPPAAAIALYRALGPATLTLVNENPYLLCGDPVYLPFERADQIAEGLNFAADAEVRVLAGIAFVLRHNAGNGHSCLPEAKLLPTAARFLGVPQEVAETLLQQGREDGTFGALEYDGRRYIYLPELLRAELLVAGHLKTLMALPTVEPKGLNKSIDRLEAAGQLQYAPAQREAIRTATFLQLHGADRWAGHRQDDGHQCNDCTV